MARNYGRFTTSIYRDDDFRALNRAEQGVYFMLGLQPDVTAAGVLSLTVRRWAQTADGDTPEHLTAHLGALEDRGHVVIDERTEELLIRKFIKWDGGWGNSKRLPVVIEALHAIGSVHIRDVAVDELRKIVASDALSDEGKRAQDALRHALSPFDRVVVTLGDQIPQPLTATLGGEPLGDDAEPPCPFCPQHMPRGTTEPCGACGTAKRMLDAWHERDAARRAAEIEARRTAVLACRRCDDQGWTDDEDGNPTVRCDHTQLALIVGLGGV